MGAAVWLLPRQDVWRDKERRCRCWSWGRGGCFPSILGPPRHHRRRGERKQSLPCSPKPSDLYLLSISSVSKLQMRYLIRCDWSVCSTSVETPKPKLHQMKLALIDIFYRLPYAPALRCDEPQVKSVIHLLLALNPMVTSQNNVRTTEGKLASNKLG